jgi:hypothetical protein
LRTAPSSRQRAARLSRRAQPTGGHFRHSPHTARPVGASYTLRRCPPSAPPAHALAQPETSACGPGKSDRNAARQSPHPRTAQPPKGRHPSAMITALRRCAASIIRTDRSPRGDPSSVLRGRAFRQRRARNRSTGGGQTTERRARRWVYAKHVTLPCGFPIVPRIAAFTPRRRRPPACPGGSCQR